MKTSAIIRIIIYSIVVVFLTGFLIGTLTDRWSLMDFIPHDNINCSMGWNSKYRSKNTSRNMNSGGASVPIDRINEIDLYWISGDVDISVYDGDQIVFSESSRKKITEENVLQYTVNGTKLTIDFSKKMDHLIRFSPNKIAKSLTLKIPQKMNLRKLEIENVSSDINLDSTICRELTISNVSGDINGSSIVADILDCDTVSGDVELKGRFQNIKHNAVSGDITITNAICPKEIDGETISGDITLIIPENDGFTVDYDKVSGKLACDFAVTTFQDRVVYEKGNAKFDYSTISGDIHIKKQ